MLVGWPVATVMVLEKVPSPLATLLVVVAPGWLFTFGLIRAGWMGVRVGDEGVRVRNLTRTYDLRWDDIEYFSVGGTPTLPSAAIVNLVGGTTLPISGIQPRNRLFFPHDRTAIELAEALNAELAARR